MTDKPMSNLESSIRDLVAANEAFWTCKMTPVERRARADWDALHQWATMLRNAQNFLGIEVVADNIVASNIAEAEAGIAAAKSMKEPF